MKTVIIILALIFSTSINAQAVKVEKLKFTEATCDGEYCAFIFESKTGNTWQASNLPKNNVITFETNSSGKKQINANLINKQYIVKYKRLGEFDNEIEILDIKDAISEDASKVKNTTKTIKK